MNAKKWLWLSASGNGILFWAVMLLAFMLPGVNSFASEARKPDLKAYPGMSVSAYSQRVERNLLDFKQYPVKATYTGKPAKLVLDTPDAKMFRTRLRQTQDRPADFAGEYVLSLFGCGADCVMGAAVSKRTGHVVFLPGSVCCWYGEGDEASKLEFRLDSRLLIARGHVNEGDEYGTYYYEFTGSKFKQVHFVKADIEAHRARFGERMEQGFAAAEKVLEQQKQQELALCPPGRACGWVGMNMGDLTAENTRMFRLKTSRREGAIVFYVDPKNPAHLAGIKAGDVLIGINGIPVGNEKAAEKTILALKPNEVARFSVLRNDKPFVLSVKVAQRPPWPCISQTGPSGPPRCGK